MDPKDQDIICLFRVTDVSSGPIKDISYLLTFLTPFLHIEIIGYWWEYYRIISLSISVAFLYIIELNLRQVIYCELYFFKSNHQHNLSARPKFSFSNYITASVATMNFILLGSHK